LFLSTSEKFGADELLEALEPPEAAGEDGLLVDEPVELLPLDEGEVAEGVLDDDDGLLDDEEDCATANVDSAKSTAAAVTLRVLRIWRSPAGWWWQRLPPIRRKRCARERGARMY
jgi:hypothetical protein